MNLDALFAKFGTDKHEHDYAAAYERNLGPLREEVITLLEIGVWKGASLLAWADWMPNALIVGVDNAPQVAISAERIQVVTCDIKEFKPEGAFDVIVDDGSHFPTDIVAAHALLWPHLNPGGWYVIEDLDAQPENSSALYLIEDCLRELYHERGDVAQIDASNQICFLRKR